MNAESITTIISSVGFPIAACIGLFWYMTKQQERHEEETKKLTEAINELKIVLTTILTKLGEDDE